MTPATETSKLTKAQIALKNYYLAIIELEKTCVISDHAGDSLSEQMMDWVGDYEDYDGTPYRI